jgi:hypothetical protein
VSTDTPIRAPFVDERPLVLRLELGACRLRVAAGGDGPWVEGSYHDPTDDLPPQLLVDRGTVTLRQDRTVAGGLGLLRGAPTCELRLGTGQPFRLELETGAGDVDLDLGGVPLTALAVRAGAGKVSLVAHRPNPVELDELSVRMGAGSLRTAGLGNLAAARVRTETGAAGVSLDLTGELRRHLDVRVQAGMSGIEVIVPGDRPARVVADTTLGSTDLGPGFVTEPGGVVRTPVDGEPVVEVRASVALGGLQLRAR